MEDLGSWLPDRSSWTDASGTVWTPGRPRRLTEADGRRFARRPSVRVAVEHLPGSPDVEWIDHQACASYWDHHVAGHVDDGTGRSVPPNERGLTYHVSSWRDPQGGRMILLPELC